MSEPTSAAAEQRATPSADAPDASRLWRGVGWGVLATIAMSIPMLIGTATGMSPIPEPIPKALVTLVFGAGLPAPLLMLLAAGSHLAYGGFFGGVLARFVRPVTLGKGLGLGAVLWLVMQVVVLPLLGWGFFGAAVTLKITVASLLLHLIYGAVLGWGLDR